MKNPYFTTYNEQMKKIFGCRVYKISIDGGFTCPNRDGKKSKNGCIFCDERGSSSRTHMINTPIKEQILKNIQVRKTRYKAKKFIVYFQSFTNTYADIKTLKKLYDEALFSHPDIVGISISTRPDCIDKEKLDLISSYKKDFPYVCIELGMQTIHDKTLKLINRHETHNDFLNAYNLINQYDIEHCIHVILNLPGETTIDQIETAKKLASLKIKGLKIHTLAAMKNTELEKLYLEKKWIPQEFDDHINLICEFIKNLNKECIIHRISGNGHPLHLVAPMWIKEKKNKILERVLVRMKN